MAVLFDRRVGDTRYQVRSAGGARRLYSNGVFHSQWNPRRVLAGAVWDLLSLPLLYLPQASDESLRVLLLGVGGGAVLQQLRHLAPRAELVGVELDAMHLQLAQQYFGVDERVATLHHGDARDWVRDYRGPGFDLVIDDLFSHGDGEPRRAVAMERRWAAALGRVCLPQGALVANFTGARELRECALMRQPYRRVYQWSQRGYDNAVGVWLRGDGDARSWRTALLAHPQLGAADRRRALAARRRKLA